MIDSRTGAVNIQDEVGAILCHKENAQKNPSQNTMIGSMSKGQKSQLKELPVTKVGTVGATK